MLLSSFRVPAASKILAVSCQIPHRNQSHGHKNDGIQDVFGFYW